MNSSVSPPPVSFTVYGSFGVSRFALVAVVLALYLSGLCVSLFLVLVVCVESRLHRPMYFLLAHLAASGVLGSSTVCPIVSRHLLAGGRQVSLRQCLTQVFFTNVYAGCVFCILALMAFDRYVSVCQPLRYHAIMTPARVKLMLAAVYFTLSSSSGVQVYLTSRLRLCRHSVDKLFCDSLALAELSCEKTAAIGAFGLVCAACVVVLPCVLVVLSYVHIFAVVLKTEKASRSRALQTCTPHLVTFINFSAASFFGFIYNRVSRQVPPAVNVLTFVNFFVVPPLLHPVVYGIQMREIRQSMSRMMRGRTVRLN